MNDYIFQVIDEDLQMTRRYEEAMKNVKRKEEPLMKISEMTTANFANFIDAAGDHICNIMQNPSIAALFTSPESKNPMRWMIGAAKVLFGPCREDVFAVIGAMHGKSADEIGNQNILVTLGQLRSVYEDLKSADIPE